jgi:hypothetical protein
MEIFQKIKCNDNMNRLITIIIHVNIYEINLYSPCFLNLPCIMIDYSTYNVDQIPIFNGSDGDMIW